MYTFSSEDGWGMLTSSLDDARKDLFDQLKTLDFMQTEPEMLLCRAGRAHLYVRYIPAGKKTLPLAFDFCCILTISDLLYPVGLKKLQDVFAFLKEIDARPVVPQPLTLAEGERKAMQEYIATTTDQVEQRVAALLNIATWRETVERLAQALEVMSQHAVAGQSRFVSIPPLPGVPSGQQNTKTAFPETHDGAGSDPSRTTPQQD